MQYRKEIDGLRALAVLPVILFHAGFEWFSGGFVGVDVFFVISGYLITNIIIKEISEGTFSIISFYERRARRILPALFFVMALTIPFAWFWLMPNDLKDYGQSLVAVATFSSNILFWLESAFTTLESGYFDTAAELKPLLHTWSLAVEEQYYIIYPIFMLMMYRFGFKYLLHILFLAFIFSLFFAHFGSSAFPDANFYLLPTRGWELLLGAFSAFFLRKYSYFSSVIANQSLSLTGFLMIVFSIIFFDESTPFPSFYALLPTIGTCLLIIFVTPSTLVYKLLSIRLIVGIGLVSYSAYLWHQPILAFANHRLLENISDLFLILLCIGSLFMAWFSWALIEKPFRDKKQTTRRFIFSFSIAGIIIFSIIGTVIHFSNGFPDRIPTDLSKSFLKQENHSCNFKFDDTLNLNWETNPCNVKNNIFLIGDSHAQALSLSMHLESQNSELNLTTLTANGCLPIKGIKRADETMGCRQLKDFLYKNIFDKQNTIIFASRWRINIEGERYNNGEGGIETGKSGQVFLENPMHGINLIEYLKEQINVIANNSKLILINQIPEVGINVPKRYYLWNENNFTHSYSQYLYQNSRVNEVLLNIKKANLIEVDKIICNKFSKRCSTKIDGNVLYFDDDHPSKYLADIISIETFKEINLLDLD